MGIRRIFSRGAKRKFCPIAVFQGGQRPIFENLYYYIKIKEIFSQGACAPLAPPCGRPCSFQLEAYLVVFNMLFVLIYVLQVCYFSLVKLNACLHCNVPYAKS